MEWINPDAEAIMARAQEEAKNNPVSETLTPEQIVEIETNNILNTRKWAYPPLADFADAWVKNDEVALEEYRQACLAVKAQYPKPT